MIETRTEDALEVWLAATPRPAVGARLGFSFRGLHAYGFTSLADYQATVGSYLLVAGSMLRRILSLHHRRKVHILHEFDGLVRSGEMLLVLGRPGSGCSTMLKALAGDTHGFEIDINSDINYEGISFDHLHRDCRGAAIYQAELDVHFPELTLEETLGFVAMAKIPRERGQKTEEGVRRPEPFQLAQVAASIFGLAKSTKTIIGNEVLRGVSGGEKKRTSIAEAFMIGAPIQAWDNTTRGLDSLTALEVIANLKRSAAWRGASVMISVYQASQSIYDLFDKVTLLYEGHQVFFGSTTQAVHYFQSLGFVKSERHSTADFLTSLTNPRERSHMIRPGCEDSIPRTPTEFADVWRTSPTRQKLLESIALYNAEHPMDPDAVRRYHIDKSPERGHERSRPSPYTISTLEQVAACVQRGYHRLRNNPVPVISGVIGNTIAAIIISSIFYNLPETTDSFYARGVLIFYSIVMNAGISAFDVLTMWAARPIVEKHNSYKFYHPFIESAASMICDLPNKILTSIGFNLSIYFMTNLHRTPGAFFTFYLFSFTCLVTMSMFFRMVGSLSRTAEGSMPPVANLMLLFIIYAGFVIPVKYMHPWLGWIRWINPIAYSFESLMINEFAGRIFACSSMIPSGPTYTDVPATSRVCPTVGSEPGESFVQGERYLESQYGYVLSHLWRNYGIIVAMMVLFCIIHLLAAEYIPGQRSKGEILLFRRGHRAAEQIPVCDEEKTEAAIDQSPGTGPRNGTATMVDDRTTILDNLQKQTAIFHWDGISYDVKGSNQNKRILDDVDGFVKPGTLTALMGVTGAGKTTLLDVLACRTSVGVVSGLAYINGRPRDGSFQRKTGYVQQSDIHLATATVYETLVFNALLRQPASVPKAEKLEYVAHVLRALDMEPYADAVVGILGEGLNVEQRKRLSIAVELVAKPELLLFLDEPTSGLDSQTAWSICTLLRQLADGGQAILCTIHQPSSQLFQLFDRLLLLQNGGKTLYFGDVGDEASTIIRYFESNGAESPDAGVNPAEWILTTTKADDTTLPRIDWAEKWRSSPERQEIKRQLVDMKEKLSAISPREHLAHDEFATSIFYQYALVTHRIFQEYWRDPVYLYSKIALSAGIGFFNGFSFYMTKLDVQGLINILFSIFMLSSIFNNVDQQIIPRFMRGRQFFETRERPSKTYSWVVFVASNIFVEAAWQTVTAVLLFVVWYYPTGLWKNGDASFTQNERGGLMFGLIWIFCVFMSTVSQAIAAAIEHAETAVNLAQLVSSLWLIFCGVLVPASQLPGFWIFMYRVSPLTYLVDAMTSTGIGNTDVTCSPYELLQFVPPDGQTCGQYMSAYLSYPGVSQSLVDPQSTTQCLYCSLQDTNTFLATMGISVSNRWRNFGLQFCYVIFNIIVIFFLYWVARVPKRRT